MDQNELSDNSCSSNSSRVNARRCADTIKNDALQIICITFDDKEVQLVQAIVPVISTKKQNSNREMWVTYNTIYEFLFFFKIYSLLYAILFLKYINVVVIKPT